MLHQAGRKKRVFAIKVVFLLCAIVIVVVVAILADYDLVMTIRNLQKKKHEATNTLVVQLNWWPIVYSFEQIKKTVMH